MIRVCQYSTSLSSSQVPPCSIIGSVIIMMDLVFPITERTSGPQVPMMTPKKTAKKQMKEIDRM